MPRPNWYKTEQADCHLRSVSYGGGYVPGYPQPFLSREAAETVSIGSERRLPRGWREPSPYRFTMENLVYATGTAEAYSSLDGSFIAKVSGNVAPFVDGYGSAFNEACSNEMAKSDELGLRSRSNVAARLKLKDTDINLGVAFGERKQTARLLGDTATRIAKSFRYLRRGQPRRAMDELGISSRKREPRGNNVPSKWLEMQYGWKPLLSDVYGAATALSKQPKSDWRVTAKATRSKEDNYEFKTVPNWGWIAHTSRAKVKQSVFTRIDALPANEAAISLTALGVTNPLLVAWELVPFSFVVDWCLPVGDWLDSLDALLGYETASYSQSYRVTGDWVVTGQSGKRVDADEQIFTNWKATKRLVYLDRQVSLDVPLPTFPRIKDPRSLGHMANGLALLTQVFGRR
jgi:hypothetical protein